MNALFALFHLFPFLTGEGRGRAIGEVLKLQLAQLAPQFGVLVLPVGEGSGVVDYEGGVK